jgi:UDP-glucose 4-epimerase
VELHRERAPLKILVTGSAGFIAGYLIEELLARGHEVVGLDNYSKYGHVEKSYQRHPKYTFVEGDAKDVGLLSRLAAECDHFVAGAARIGGISYFHEYAYDLLAENERIVASSFDAALASFRKGRLLKITVLSSSMVYENATVFPSPEEHLRVCPPPTSTYGFQKLACEYFARGAWEQHRLPYTICRPFNCVGVGESRALGGKEVPSGNVRLAMSHVVPDLVQKVLKGQDPLHILGSGDQVRCYTYGGDLARGIAVAMFHPAAQNEDFNLSTPISTTVRELAKAIWEKVHGVGPSAKPFRVQSDPPYPHDVARRLPDTNKAKRVLGFEATTSLSEMLDEVVPWIREEIAAGRI